MTDVIPDRLNQLLPALRATDIILAVLQAAFTSPTLLGSTNPLRFVRDDPKNSPVWICGPEGRTNSERDGRAQTITVQRGDYVPNELHLHNHQGGNLSDQMSFTDLAAIPVFILCEAGNRVASEVLASVAYNVLKMFRRNIMKDFDVHNIRLMSISTANPMTDAAGSPFVTTVSVRVEIQEYALLTELATHVNVVGLKGLVVAEMTANIAELHNEEAFPPVAPLPGHPGSPENPLPG